jgi:hypothetical protein
MSIWLESVAAIAGPARSASAKKGDTAALANIMRFFIIVCILE